MRIKWRLLSFFLLLFFCFCAQTKTAFSHSPYLIQVSKKKFTQLGIELLPKVNLFAAVLKADPHAKFFGGTSRDYLYWLMGQFRNLKTTVEIDAKISELKKRPIIDIREILGIESDVDVITQNGLSINPSTFGVRKIDSISPDRFKKGSELSKNEIDQGFIPIEKIQISQNKIFTPSVFGDGVEELLTGKLSVHFTEDKAFWNSYYASKHLNHPVLLAIRYLRLRAMHWYQMNGSEVPDVQKLLTFDESIKTKIKSVFNSATSDPKFKLFLDNKQGLAWLNASILKAFRAYTSPTAAYHLFSSMGFKQLQEIFPQIESINQFLFIQNRDFQFINQNFKKYEFKSNEVYVEPSSAIPDLRLFHGTNSEASFRGIIFQNIMPSVGGSAGAGLYAVSESNVEFAVSRAGSKDLVVVLKISPDAKIIDISQGAGKDLFEKWNESNDLDGNLEDAFAQAFGADILIYPYKTEHASTAYVIKNSKVIQSRQGLSRQLVPISQVVKNAEQVKTVEDFEKLLDTIYFNSFSQNEVAHLFFDIIGRERLKDLRFELLSERKIKINWYSSLLLITEPSVDLIFKIIEDLESDSESLLKLSHMLFTTLPLVHNFAENIIYRILDNTESLPFPIFAVAMRFGIDQADKDIWLNDLTLTQKLIRSGSDISSVLEAVICHVEDRPDDEHLIRFRNFLRKIENNENAQISLIQYMSSSIIRNDNAHPSISLMMPHPVHFSFRSIISKIIYGKSEDIIKCLLDSYILLAKNDDGLGSLLDSSEFLDWMKHLVRMNNPPISLITHVFLKFEEVSLEPHRGSDLDKFIPLAKQSLLWISELTKNKSLSPHFKQKLVSEIIDRDVDTSEAAEFVIENTSYHQLFDIRLNYYIESTAIKYSKAQESFALKMFFSIGQSSSLSKYLSPFADHKIKSEKVRKLLSRISAEYLHADSYFYILEILRKSDLKCPYMQKLLVNSILSVDPSNSYGHWTSIDGILQFLKIANDTKYLSQTTISSIREKIYKSDALLDVVHRIYPSLAKKLRLKRLKPSQGFSKNADHCRKVLEFLESGT